MALSPWVRPIAYCEIDRYCQAVLLSRMHDGAISCAPIWDDVTTLVPELLPGSGIDIIYGGFPCQDISVAGNGAGLAGERSGLFFEIARLVSEIRPRFVFLENVPAIRTRGADVVVGRLASLGYDCRWGVLSAFDVGAPHLRERWWLLANARSGRCVGRHGTVRFVADASCQPERQQNDETATERERRTWSRRDPFGRGWWESESGIRRVVDGLPNRVDRLRGLGNAVVPAQAREAFRRLMGL